MWNLNVCTIFFKRAHPDIVNPEETTRDVPYYTNPSAIKRGTNFNLNLKSQSPDQQSLNEWEQEQAMYQNQDLSNLHSSLYNAGENPFDDKTIAEYEKGFHYGTNKDKLDEALENAVLKSELYGDPAAVNQYRYYGSDDRKRKRRNAKLRMDNRMKREVELTPDEILSILTLYESNRQPHPSEYRPSWHRFEPSFDLEPNDGDLSNLDQDDGSWLDTPVYPHATAGHSNEIGPNYFLEDNQLYENRGRWGGYPGSKNKRFMVTKKRSNDPTHELRFLNGPNKNDFYTLSQLLSNQREPNLPVYHRLVL